MEQVEELVHDLYAPNVPFAVRERAQSLLQAAQRCPKGWAFGLHMLESANPNTQFLGAQALLVQLKTGTHLPPIDTQRTHVLTALQNALANHYSPFVIRKIISVVVKMFLNSDWPDCLAQVIEILGPRSPYCHDFLEALIHYSELPHDALRAKLVPDGTNLVTTLITEDLNALSLRTFEVWATAFFNEFKPLLSGLINGMFVDDDELSSQVLHVIDNLYSSDPRSWPASARAQLGRSLEQLVARQPLAPEDGLAHDKFEMMARLVITYCSEDLSQTSLHPFLANIAKANGEPVIGDALAMPCIGFWSQYTEEIVSSGMRTSSNEVILSVISNYWPRIRIYNDLRGSDSEEFYSFRREFADLLQLAYPLMGSELFSHLADLVLISLRSLDWYGIESAMFCLEQLSDIIGDDYRGERPELRNVRVIFQSDLWTVLPLCEDYRVKQTAVMMIGSFEDFFATPEGRPYLAVTLNYLFTCLAEKHLQNVASLSINKLCDTCRDLLTDEISAFITAYSGLRTKLIAAVQMRTISGITYVIEAEKNPEIRADALVKLLQLCATNKVPQWSADMNERLQLKSIAAVAKSYRCGENEVDIQFGPKLQEIMGVGLASEDVTCVEAVCELVRAGLSEESGPFKISEDVAVALIVQKFAAGPDKVLKPVLDLAKFDVMMQRANVKKKQPFRADLVAELVKMLDREVSVPNLPASLDVLTQVASLARALQVQFLDLGPAGVLKHAYAALLSSDRFVLKSAAAFWKEFLLANQLSVEIAQQLVRIVVQQISQDATRSELPAVVDILKLLVSKHSLVACDLLREAIVTAPQTPGLQQLDVKARSDYVAQLVLLKGARRTYDVSLRFWQACRNIPDTYDPHSAK